MQREKAWAFIEELEFLRRPTDKITAWWLAASNKIKSFFLLKQVSFFLYLSFLKQPGSLWAQGGESSKMCFLPLKDSRPRIGWWTRWGLTGDDSTAAQKVVTASGSRCSCSRTFSREKVKNKTNLIAMLSEGADCADCSRQTPATSLVICIFVTGQRVWPIWSVCTASVASPLLWWQITLCHVSKVDPLVYQAQSGDVT